MPLLLAQANPHDGSGIFAADVTTLGSTPSDGYRLLTGSKDYTACISRWRPTGFAGVERSFDELHGGVVKTVHWQPVDGASIFASGAMDRAVCVKDIRVPGAAADVRIEDAHAGGVHTVCWSPGSGAADGATYTLMTAGHDAYIRVWDLRRVHPSSPLAATPRFAFRGHHHDVGRSKYATILPPRWVDPRVVCAAGEGSLNLSLYCADTGTTLSRGAMPDYPIAIAVHRSGPAAAVPHRIAVSCKRGGLIYMLSPDLAPV